MHKYISIRLLQPVVHHLPQILQPLSALCTLIVIYAGTHTKKLLLNKLEVFLEQKCVVLVQVKPLSLEVYAGIAAKTKIISAAEMTHATFK